MLDEPMISKLYRIQTKFSRGFSLHYFTLYSIVYGLETKNSYEFGTGVSTQIILKALKETGGVHTSCSKSSKEEICNGSIKDNPLWTHHHMKSELALPLLKEEELFDFVLHDGAHNGKVVCKDLQIIIPHMKQYSMLLVHDTQHSSLGKALQEAVVESLKNVKYSMVVLPYGCGLTIVRIEGNEHNGQVSITKKKANSPNTTTPF